MGAALALLLAILGPDCLPPAAQAKAATEIASACAALPAPIRSRCPALLATLYPCAAAVPPLPASSMSVWANDGGDKVTRDEQRASKGGAVTSATWDGTTIRVWGARNEVVAFNVVIEAPAGAAKVAVALPVVAGAGPGALLAGKATGDGVFAWTGRNVELFVVRYLTIRGLSRLSYERYDERHVPKRFRRPFTGEGFATGTWTNRPDADKAYPEIAVPIELVPTFDIAAGTNQSVWVDVYVPKTAAAGVYRGTLTVTVAGVAVNALPVELTVHGFTLPDVPSAKTMVTLGYPDIAERYLGARDPLASAAPAVAAIRDRHFAVAHRHKLSLVDSNDGPLAWNADAPRPEWKARLDGSLFTAARGYDGPGVGKGNGVFSIGHYGSWKWDGGSEADMRTHTNAWASWFAANAPATEAFLYLVDESSDYATIDKWASWINANPGPGKAILSMATIPVPSALGATPHLDVAASWFTVGQTAAWSAAAAVWSSTAGKRLWLYNGKRPSQGSFATEDDGVALRELAWAQYKMGVARWYFWESTYYNNFQGGTGATNVFASAFTFGGKSSTDPQWGETGWNYSNGDGVLFYPGTDKLFPADSYGVAGPFASLRMKHWRRGIEDVDYLVLAAAKNAGAVKALVSQLVPKALWEYGVSDPSDPTWVRSDISWTTDPAAWEAARVKLAAIIEGP